MYTSCHVAYDHMEPALMTLSYFCISYIDLRESITHNTTATIFERETTFAIFCLVFCTSGPFKKVSALKGKGLLSMEAIQTKIHNIIYYVSWSNYEFTAFDRTDKNILTELNLFEVNPFSLKNIKKTMI